MWSFVKLVAVLMFFITVFSPFGWSQCGDWYGLLIGGCVGAFFGLLFGGEINCKLLDVFYPPSEDGKELPDE